MKKFLLFAFLAVFGCASELIESIKKGDTYKFDEIIAKKPDFSVLDESGYSACDLAILHKESFYSEVFFADLLKANGCVKGKNDDKVLNIFYDLLASKEPDLKGVDLNKNLPSGLKIIHLASIFAKKEQIKSLVDNGADIKALAPKDEDRETADDCLYYAARYNQNEGMIEYLADKGFDLNKTYFHGSALIQASRHGNLRAAEELINKGADIHASTPVGGSAFTYLAGFKGSSELLKKLAKMGAELNAGIDGFGGNALDRAVLDSDDFEVVDTLLALGAGDKDEVLCTLAVAAKDGKMIDYLVGLGAKLNDDCDEGDFMFGSEDLSIERLKWLEKNSKIKISDKLRKEALSPKN